MPKQQPHEPKAPETLRCGSLRLSKRGVWRAAVLVAVHVAIALHIWHWKTAGETVSPVEPSEAMQSLELGYINAGAILFILLILSTLVFGRFFCGWGCHVVALQDLCGWILKKLGMKPKPFRSRLLVFVPLFAAFYMFVLPTLLRLFEGRAFPGWTNHLMTDDFWATFPTLGIAILTFLVCGFLLVWFVGNKGFCTYGCPYGAIFFYSDKVAPGKIRVTEDCEQCGHCTATCTSNVRVHEEVARFGMVVDAGCMKCMDCVSVCPKGALYYGFGKPSLRVLPSAPAKTPRKFDFTWPEEIAMACVFLFTLYAVRGLYGTVPLLMSLGVAALVAFGSVAVARIVYSDNVRWQRLQLKKGGKLTAVGGLALGVGALVSAFLLHSAVWNFHYHEANRLNAQALLESEEGVRRSLARRARDSFLWCDANGLFEVSMVHAGIGSAEAFLGNLAEGERRLARAVELGPELANAWVQLGRTQAALGKPDEALRTFERALEANPKNADAAHQAGLLLVSQGKAAEGAESIGRAVVAQPRDPVYLADYGLALAEAGDREAAIEPLLKSYSIDKSTVTGLNLALTLAEASRDRKVAAHDPNDARAAQLLEEARAILVGLPNIADRAVARVRVELLAGRAEEALALAESLVEEWGGEPAAHALWAECVEAAGRLDAEIARLIKSPGEDEQSWLRAAYLYLQKGDETTARSLFQRLRLRNPNLAVPH